MHRSWGQIYYKNIRSYCEVSNHVENAAYGELFILYKLQR